MLSNQLQNLNQHEIIDARALYEAPSCQPIPWTMAAFGGSGFYNLNSSYPGFDYSMASTAACIKVRVSNIESSLRFQGRFNYKLS